MRSKAVGGRPWGRTATGGGRGLGQGGRGDFGASEPGHEQAGEGQGADGEGAGPPGHRGVADVVRVAEHLDPPEEGASGRQEGPGGPSHRALVLAERHLGQGGQIRPVAPREAGAPGVGGELLLEPEPPREQVRRGVVEVQARG